MSLSFPQAMIRGELDVLKDWCYEAVSLVFHTSSTLNKYTVEGEGICILSPSAYVIT